MKSPGTEGKTGRPHPNDLDYLELPVRPSEGTTAEHDRFNPLNSGEPTDPIYIANRYGTGGIHIIRILTANPDVSATVIREHGHESEQPKEH
jgi:hypothetical protein